jgi:hypothetical protein
MHTPKYGVELLIAEGGTDRDDEHPILLKMLYNDIQIVLENAVPRMGIIE